MKESNFSENETELWFFIMWKTKAYSEPSQASKIERFAKVFNSF